MELGVGESPMVMEESVEVEVVKTLSVKGKMVGA